MNGILAKISQTYSIEHPLSGVQYYPTYATATEGASTPFLIIYTFSIKTLTEAITNLLNQYW